ncbi:BaiN/RdsA family NAD(P)/FAD-dependent oxidoreductase [Marinitoga hydrogenitolerans]|nr:NAD(P)/FAD-dependent oxidoreductase [Marinitoga hydrogenitolerans]
MNIEFDVIIIGAGPSGLFCGSNIKNKKILILEKNNSPGKKLLISGGGKCNFSNTDDLKELITHYGNKKNFIKKALYHFSNKELLEKIDFEYIIQENKVFPKSMRSKTVLNWLMKKCEENRVDIIYNSKVINVKKIDSKFVVETENKTYYSDYLIVSTGGKSYPSLGTTGDGYKIAKKFGHNIIQPKPALTPIFIKDYYFSDLSGFSTEVILRIKKEKFFGKLLFTHKGFSGPVILNSSRLISNGNEITISFVKFETEDNFREDFIKTINNNKNKEIFFVLKRYNLSKRFIAIMFKTLKLNKKTKCGNISKNDRNKIINFLYNHKFVVDRIGDFNIAMVTSGGVDTTEINSKTFESKLIKNLYFIGEVLDVDGDTGGYNIQWAFSSAKSAADNISYK